MEKRVKANNKGKMVQLVLIPPRKAGKIDPKVIEEAVTRVRDEWLKVGAKK